MKARLAAAWTRLAPLQTLNHLKIKLMEVPNIYVYVSPKIDGALSANDVSNSENLWPLRVIEHYLSLGLKCIWPLSKTQSNFLALSGAQEMLMSVRLVQCWLRLRSFGNRASK